MTTIEELDDHPLSESDRRPAVSKAFDAVAVGASFVLGNSHDPKHLREGFETQHPPGYTWEYLVQALRAWRVRASKFHSRRPALVLIPST